MVLLVVLMVTQEILMSKKNLQRKRTIYNLCVYFAKKNKVLSREEYSTAKDVPIMLRTLIGVFGNYHTMVGMLKTYEPELFALITPPPVKVSPPKVETVKTTTTVQTTAPKVAVTTRPLVTRPTTVSKVETAPAVKTDK